jgi:hypothetical protein
MSILHEIREKNYDTLKNMSIEEKINFITAKALKAKQRIDQIRNNRKKAS